MSLLKRLEKEKGSEGEKQREHGGFNAAPAARVQKDPYVDLKVRIHKEVINELEEEISKGNKMEDLDEAKLAQQIEDVVQTFLDKEAAFIPRQDRQKIVQEIIDEVLGFGPINPLINDPTVSEIMVNGPDQVYVERKGKLVLTDIKFRDNDHVLHIIEKIVAPIGRRIDESMPMVDARLPDGSRVNAIIPPLALKGPTITIRKFSKDPLKIEDLVRFGTLTVEMAKFLDACVKGKLNIVVSGGTGSGKCVTGDTPVYWSDGWESIGFKVETMMRKYSPIRDEDGWEFVDTDLKVWAFDWDKGEFRLVDKVRLWRHQAPEKLYRIKTATGREIKVTPEHPFFTLKNGSLTEINAFELSVGQYIGVTARLPKCEENKINLFNTLLSSEKLFVVDNLEQNDIVILKSRTSHESIKFLTNDRKKLLEVLWLLGLIIADGHLSGKYLEIHGNNIELLKEAQRIVFDNFNCQGQIEYPLNRVPRIRFYSSALSEVFNCFGVPKGKKADRIAPRNWWHKLDGEYLSALLSGLWDGDGYIGKNTVEYSTKSEELAEFVRQALVKLGIISVLRKRKEHYFVTISGIDNIRRFNDVFSLKNTEKQEKLNEIITRPTKANTNVDIIPTGNLLIRIILSETNFTQKQLAERLGCSTRLLRWYMAGKREMSRNMALVIGEKINTPTAQHLGKIAKLPVFWDRIVEIEQINNPEPFVYDLTVNEVHNFVAGTGGGIITHNTTTLNVLSSFIPNDERIVTIEDAAELQLRQEHVVTLETRPPNIEGKGAITMRDLVRNSLRMRPDRIVVGEVRSGEALDMLQAMNTGHDGSLTTGHANSPRDMLARLETMVLMAGMELPVRAIREQIASAIDVIVQQSRLRDGSRKITHITEVVGMEGDTIVLQDIFVYEQMGVDEKGKIIGRHRATGIRPKFMNKLEAAGIHLPEDIFINR